MQSRHFLPVVVVIPCLAQQPPSASVPNQNQEIVIPANVTEVIVPTTVRSKTRELIRSLQIQDFELYDNNKLQEITGDLSDEPISLVVAIERSSYLDKALKKIQNIGVLMGDLIAGQGGEVAVVGFDHEVHMLQDFTNESAKISSAIRNIRLGSSNHALVQAVSHATHILEQKSSTRRRVLLLIAERHDKGSSLRLRDALAAAQVANVTTYALDISSLVALGSQRAQQPPPVLPATAQHVPAGAPLTPTTVDQNYYMGNYVPALTDLFRGITNMFVGDELEVLTRFTGGRRYSLLTDSSLENAIQNISQEVHTQYLLRYVPNDQNEAGFHEIRVAVRRLGIETQTRLGYWLPAK